ncbi:MAG: hypothetical protein U0556_18220 [Dehalococcoidia bacterium]
MQHDVLTADEIQIIRSLRRYLHTGDPLGDRATVPNIIRYVDLGDAAEAAARAGEGRHAAGLRLQRMGLERQSPLSWLLTLALVVLLLLLAGVEGWRAWSDYSRIGTALQAVVGAATSPDFSKLDTALLIPDPFRGRLVPDPQGAFAPLLEDYRRRAEASVGEVRGALLGVAINLAAALVLGFSALLYAMVQPHELARRWLLPIAGRVLTSGPPG